MIITGRVPSTKVAVFKLIKDIKSKKTSYRSINKAKNTIKGVECIYGLYKEKIKSRQIYGFSPCQEIS